MASLSKKLGKTLRNNQNVIMFDPSSEQLLDMADHFENVFVFTEIDLGIKRKNIIYRREFSNFDSLPNMSLIYVNVDGLEKLLNCQTLLTKWRCFVLIGTPDEMGKKVKRMFGGASYEIIEVSKKWQMWKPSEKEIK